MSRLNVLLFLCAVLLGVQSCVPPDCDTPDCGSCGKHPCGLQYNCVENCLGSRERKGWNACCLLEFKFTLGPTNVYSLFGSNLKAGGDDGRYTYVNGTDLRPAKLKSGAQFMIQGIHRTLVHHYNDTLDFLFLSNSTSETIVRAFSISRIYGALCDSGQNYKNLVGFVKGLAQDYTQHIVFGCVNAFGNN